jgi:hypothetical protein
MATAKQSHSIDAAIVPSEPKPAAKRTTEATNDAKVQLQPRTLDIIREEFLSHNKNSSEAIYEQGKLLVEVKEQVEHGDWLNWVHSVNFHKRQAQRFMRLAKNYSNASVLSLLGLNKALALLRVSEGERDDFLDKTHLVPDEDSELMPKTACAMNEKQFDYAIRVHKGIIKNESLPEPEASHPQKRSTSLTEQAYSSVNKLLAYICNLDDSSDERDAVTEELRNLRNLIDEALELNNE